MRSISISTLCLSLCWLPYILATISNLVQDPFLGHPGLGQGHASCAALISDGHADHDYHLPPPPCISPEFINHTFTQARFHYGLTHPILSKNLDKHTDEIEQLAFVLLETSRAVAHHYNLDPIQTAELLPKLDVGGTDIPKFCPIPVQTPNHKQCLLSPYRTLSGHCNNLYHPQWGATFTPFQNFLSPHHPDALSEPRGAGQTFPLPSPRLVSQHIHHDTRIVHDRAITTMLIAWGQIIDHDITLTADTQDPRTFRTPECCYPSPSSPFHHNCLPIEIPPTDPFFSHYGETCMSFARSMAGLRPDCRLGTRKAYNRITSFLDASFIYGSNKKLSNELRIGKHGLLKSSRAFHEFGLQDLLPLKLHEPDRECIRTDDSQFCFQAGDIRVNEQLILTVLHTLLMREHNRIAKRLGQINPHWNDEKLFQETRRIVIGIVQHITYNEFLPMVLGRHTMEKHGLMLATKGYFWDGYNLAVDATAAEEFVTPAFRFGHSLLPHKIERWSHGHHFIDSQDLHSLLKQPFDLHKSGWIDTYVVGLINQLAQAMDEGVTVEVTNLLFKEPTQSFGMDLPAINIQRGREHGVPGYTYYRQLCSLSPIRESWDELTGIFRNETIHRYREIYASPHDIDLWSAGVSEIPEHDSLLGPTFSCLIAKQFFLLRAGDRFWYENPNYPSSFRLDQLDEIRTVTLSRLVCDNTDDVKTIQLYAMVYPDIITNPRVSCSGQVIPRMNLEKWREEAHQHAQTPNLIQPGIHHAHGPGHISLTPETGTAAADAPLIPLTDSHNSYHHNNGDPDHYHMNDQLDFNSVPPLPHEPYIQNYVSHPHGNELNWEGVDGGNYAKTQAHNYHYFRANHGLYQKQQQHHHHNQMGAVVGVVPEVGVGNYQYEHNNDIHGDNYNSLIESPSPSLNYDGLVPATQEHLNYFPISPVLKPPPRPHHIEHGPHYPPNTTSGYPWPNDYGVSVPGPAERPIEVHELRDLLHKTPRKERKKNLSGKHPVKVSRRNYHPKPFPNSPFPGLSGIFSPNPGYLTRQAFFLPKYINWIRQHQHRL